VTAAARDRSHKNADALGYTIYSYVSEVQISKLKLSMEFALKVARRFNVTTDQLLKDELDVDAAAGATPCTDDQS